jgi:hypothetical protein
VDGKRKGKGKEYNGPLETKEREAERNNKWQKGKREGPFGLCFFFLRAD